VAGDALDLCLNGVRLLLLLTSVPLMVQRTVALHHRDPAEADRRWRGRGLEDPLFTLPVAWCIGTLVGLHAPPAQSLLMPWLTIATFLGLGILIAADSRLSASASGGLSIALGLVQGYFSGSAMTATNFDFAVVAGTLASMFFVIAIVAAMVASLRVSHRPKRSTRALDETAGERENFFAARTLAAV
jgi:hypothetical protein